MKSSSCDVCTCCVVHIRRKPVKVVIVVICMGIEAGVYVYGIDCISAESSSTKLIFVYRHYHRASFPASISGHVRITICQNKNVAIYTKYRDTSHIVIYRGSSIQTF